MDLRKYRLVNYYHGKSIDIGRDFLRKMFLLLLGPIKILRRFPQKYVSITLI